MPEDGLSRDMSPTPSSVPARVTLGCSTSSPQRARFTGAGGVRGSNSSSVLEREDATAAMGEPCQPAASAGGAGWDNMLPGTGTTSGFGPSSPFASSNLFTETRQHQMKGGLKTKQNKTKPEIYSSINYLPHGRAAYKYGVTLDKTFMQLFRPSEI